MNFYCEEVTNLGIHESDAPANRRAAISEPRASAHAAFGLAAVL